MSEPSRLKVVADGPIGRITLDRPEALNALTHAMIEGIASALADWESESTITAILIDAAGDRAFSAGGDIQFLYHLAKNNEPARARRFWADEYRLNARIASYSKPCIALMDGITMGGGVGLGSHGSHRIVTERTMLAMPETGIGFLPDVGSTFLLSRAPGHTGLYLGMTGTRLGAADAIYAGFADHHVPSDRLDDLIRALGAGEEMDDVIGRFSTLPDEGDLPGLQERIADGFGQNSALACVERLEERGQAGDAWAQKTAALLRRHSPLSVASTFEAVRRAADLPSMEDCLALEYRFAHRTFGLHDFVEGVRAVVIDKDRNPQWQPARLEDVTQDMVDEMLADLGPDEWSPVFPGVDEGKGA